jgi:hypothetical protein
MELVMTKPDPRLQSLADIQEPLLASDWYLAPIWWLLAVFVLLLLGWLIRRVRMRQPQQAATQLALRELSAIALDQSGSATAITALLKRYVQTKMPQHPALTQTGAQWQQFLVQSLRQPAAQALPDLLALHYQAAPAEQDLIAYAEFARHWLQHHQPDLATVTLPQPSPGVRDA